jgi:hypothetical protein
VAIFFQAIGQNELSSNDDKRLLPRVRRKKCGTKSARDCTNAAFNQE